MLPGVLEPGGQVVEGVPPGDIVHEERSGGAPVVGARDGPERLLTRLRGHSGTCGGRGRGGTVLTHRDTRTK